MKKRLLGTLTLAMAVSMGMAAGAEGDIVVLYTNDVHCAVAQDDENQVLGYAKVAALKEELEEAGSEVILVDAGDAIQGEAIGTLSSGEYLVQIMDEVGYDIAVPGNHEFDYGMEQFLKLAEEADYDYISANFTDLTTGEPVFDAYEIEEEGGVKIAFVGVCTPKTITSSTPVYFQNDAGEYIYGFRLDETGAALYDCVQSAVDAARAEGADYVIAVTHLGIEAECSPWMSTELIGNTNGIDVVLDGHSHSTIEGDLVKNKDGANVLMTSTGTKLSAIGKLTIAEDGALSSELVYDYEGSDPEVEAFIAGIQAEFEETLNQVVAKTDVALVINEPSTLDKEEKIRLVRNAETNLGDLCADAYRYVSGADVALVNGGGIRTDILAGDITYDDIISVHPFGNELCMVEATGQQILDALEMGARVTPEENGGFLQVSGLTYEIHTDMESTVKLDENGMFQGMLGDYRVQNVMIGDEPLDPDKTYTVASHNYMLKNAGDGINMFTECELLLEDIMLDNQVLITYITEGLGGVVGEEYAEPYGQGRIVAVEG
ncbi:MAG: bifunctional metallophosphatase/5'-nucleotidase [Marvinbryantia sp.]|uniref:bifunctional metallophosphatase/5'-nucleotidase n=1 Tax=Marvinbryantia sp. TaxID=2496532 RepID=UPI00399B7E09